MKNAPLSRRNRQRHILAELRMPGALEALDAILQGVDGGALTAPEAIEHCCSAQIQLCDNRRLQAAMRSSRMPRRYEHASTVLTSNRGFEEWSEVFGADDVMAADLLDRLVHHCHLVIIRGNSYRHG